ncbi:MAG: hypothetical protein GY710_00385 [Desulfobacteraceae bacterium]|nr:hypothetical protein [Desulfobacteraceae bacterium]
MNLRNFFGKNMIGIALATFISILTVGPVFALDNDEPPVNSFLADSPWPMSHRNPYCQASSPYPGPEAPVADATSDIVTAEPGTITLAVSGPYEDGSRVIWTSAATKVYKIDANGDNWKKIDTMPKERLEWDGMPTVEDGLTGAYTLIDKDNIYYMPRYTKLFAIGDSVEGDAYSPIEVKREYEIPTRLLTDSTKEKIVGLNMTYDGMLVFVTGNGLVGAVSRDFKEAYYLSLGAGNEVSNSIACDENGGIYVVSSKKMYKIQWTGQKLSLDERDGGWAADYETGDTSSGIRLGEGSGSTPTLMGTGDQDKFVCITDGKDLMDIVLFWRDQIPADWNQIEGTKDRRIAAQKAITFGNPDAVQSLSEQSVCIRGYGAFVVNNQLAYTISSGWMNLFASGITFNAPRGAEKFVWDPATRTLDTAWVNQTISYPNAIPSMSSATNLIYNVGQVPGGGWTFDALDWDTGEKVFSYTYGHGPRFNSAYGGTEIGLDGSLYIGSFGGPSHMKP